jgi:hypothetical protein
MRTPSNFKGQITFVSADRAQKKVLVDYFLEVNESALDQIIMSSFMDLNFSPEEKKSLSSSTRKKLNDYRQLNPLAINCEAEELIKEIKSCKDEYFTIEAKDVGVFICLTALFSGNFPQNKKIEFHFNGAPLALFPKKLCKESARKAKAKIVYKIEDNSWLKPFETLVTHEYIKCHYLKSA